MPSSPEQLHIFIRLPRPSQARMLGTTRRTGRLTASSLQTPPAAVPYCKWVRIGWHSRYTHSTPLIRGCAHDARPLDRFGARHAIAKNMSTNNPANIPAEVIASLPDSLRAQIPHYNETLQPNLYAAATICFAAVCAAVGLRLDARRLKCQKLKWDDYMILIALGLYVPFYLCAILAVVLGTGRHQVVIILEHSEQGVLSEKTGLTVGVLYLVPLYFTKVWCPSISSVPVHFYGC